MKKVLISIPILFLFIISFLCMNPTDLIPGLVLPSWLIPDSDYYSLTLRITELPSQIRYDYINSKGEITFSQEDHYATKINTLNENGKTILEQYFDENGIAIALPAGHYYIRREYDDQNRNILLTYLDQNKNPLIISSGYATIKRTFNDHNLAEYEFYYDTSDQPVIAAMGVHGTLFEYNDEGLRIKTTYLDLSGNPTTNSSGYVVKKCTYYPDGSLRTEQYYDSEGNPVALKNGCYGLLYRNEKAIYLDHDGNEMFNLSNFLHQYPFIVLIAGVLMVLIVIHANKAVSYLFLVVYLAFIAYMTLLQRESGYGKPMLEIFWSYRRFLYDQVARLDILKNIWLFIPYGAVLCNLAQKRTAVPIAFFTSVLIEVSQYIFHIGYFEFDDMISNTLGAFLGVLMYRLFK